VERPDGSTLSTDDRTLYVVRSERYRFFHIPKPAAGVWRVRAQHFAPLQDAIAAIQNYDLRLDLAADDQATVGSPLEIRVALVAGEGGGMPDIGFLARHKFSARAKIDGAFQELSLTAAPDGAKLGKLVPAKPGTIELFARVEPGPEGSLTRTSAPLTVTVVPPLQLVFPGPIDLGELKPGAKTVAQLDLSKSAFMGEVKLEVDAEDLWLPLSTSALPVKPKKLELSAKKGVFEVSFEVPSGAAPGRISGMLKLIPSSKPYIGREGAHVPVQATIIPLTFWEQHGNKVVSGLMLAFLAFFFAGFKTPARFPKKIRVWYQDKPNGDEGDFGLWMRAKPGFYKSAIFRIGGGGPIRRSSPLLCEIAATGDGIRVRPAKGSVIKSGGDEHTREFRPEYKARYEVGDGLTFWIGKEEEED